VKRIIINIKDENDAIDEVVHEGTFAVGLVIGEKNAYTTIGGKHGKIEGACALLGFFDDLFELMPVSFEVAMAAWNLRDE
jgi:hypothetical protein